MQFSFFLVSVFPYLRSRWWWRWRQRHHCVHLARTSIATNRLLASFLLSLSLALSLFLISISFDTETKHEKCVNIRKQCINPQCACAWIWEIVSDFVFFYIWNLPLAAEHYASITYGGDNNMATINMNRLPPLHEDIMKGRRRRRKNVNQNICTVFETK